MKRTLFTEEHNLFRDTFRHFVEKEIVPYNEQWEKDGASSAGAGMGLHNDIVLPYLLAYATEEQKQRWLPGMCAGDRRLWIYDRVSYRSCLLRCVCAEYLRCY